jgi:hypothetical protein
MELVAILKTMQQALGYQSGTVAPINGWKFEVGHDGQVHKSAGPNTDPRPGPLDATILAVVDAANRIASHFGSPHWVDWEAVDGRVFIRWADRVPLPHPIPGPDSIEWDLS